MKAILINKVLLFFSESNLLSIIIPVITTIIGIFLGARITYLYGIKKALELDNIKRKQEEISAVRIISGELLRLIKWYEYLIKYKNEERPFEIWGMFIPTNSFWIYRDIMQKILNTNDYKDLEDAYINFGVHDRQMQSVIQAWLVSGQKIPTAPAVRWHEVFWSSITSDDTKNLINRLRLIFDKLRVMNI